MTGRYLALEGIEGAGKTTVADRLAESLQEPGRRVVTVREPGGTRAGEGIRGLLLHSEGEMAPWTEALLFAAQRAQLAAEVIGPALAAGTWVVGDRSVYSSLAYQGGARGLGIEQVRAVNEAGLCGVWPDLVVLLRIEPDAGLARQAVPDRIGAEGADFQHKVGEAFDLLAAAEPQRFVVVGADRPLAEVVEEVVRAVMARW